jgi:guanylate kinase
MKESGCNNERLLEIDPKPLLLVLSGPSGAGKDAVLARLKQLDLSLEYIVTVTTRPKRCNEQDNVHYCFVSSERFQQMKDGGELLEYAQVYGNWYGVPRQPVKQALEAGNDVMLKVDIQGAETIKKALPEAVFIFLTPLSKADLDTRLRGRNSETPADRELRLKTAEKEMQKLPLFDYIVVNEHGQLDKVIDRIEAIITAEKLRVNQRRYCL